MHNLIILAGGFGTRLQSVSNGTPKALTRIGDKVFQDILLEKIFSYNISHVYLSLYYKPELFNSYIINCRYKNKISINVEPIPLGTGGAINHVINNSTIKSPFFVVNGDSLSDINLHQMAKQFDKKSYEGMVGISKVRDAKRYGTVNVDNQSVLSFNEKGKSGEGWINNGYYILTKKAFDGFTGAFSLEKDFFPQLALKGELAALKVENDHFIDMGIPEDYYQICKLYGK